MIAKSDSEAFSEQEADKQAIESAMREAVRDAVIMHKRMGLPMVVWRDGQVVWVPADELVVNDEPATK